MEIASIICSTIIIIAMMVYLHFREKKDKK